MSEHRVGVLRSRIATTLRAAIWPVVLIALVVLLTATVSVSLMAAMPLALLGGILLAIRAATAARPVVHRGVLRERDGTLLVAGRKLVERSAVVSGAVVPHGGEGVLVRLERKHMPPIDLQVADVEHARAVIETLELDPRHAVARFHLLATDAASWQRRMRLMVPILVLFAIGTALSGISRTPGLIPLFAGVIVAASLSIALPRRVTVGSDGISVRSVFGSEFVPLDGVADAEVADVDSVMNATLCVVRLLGEDGVILRELVVDQKKHGPLSEGLHRAVDARAHAFAERIREVIALRAAREDALDPKTLARGDRELVDWVRTLRALLSQTTGFRDEEPPTPEALLAIVEDASARPLDRAAAAIALSRADEPFKQRVRVAADATAAPRLRVALAAAVDDDEQKLASALEEIERAREG